MAERFFEFRTVSRQILDEFDLLIELDKGDPVSRTQLVEKAPRRFLHQSQFIVRAARSVEQQHQVEGHFGRGEVADLLPHAIFINDEILCLQLLCVAHPVLVCHLHLNRNQIGVNANGVNFLFLGVLRWVLRLSFLLRG